MENKDENELFEDMCNIARVLPNLAASTIYSDLKNTKDDPNRVKLILRKYFASYEAHEHNCMSDDIKKIKRVLPEYPFIHINNDLLAVEDKENRIQLVLKRYFDNQVKAAKRSLLLDNIDSTNSSPDKRFKSNEETTDSPSIINSEQITNSEEKEHSSNETETESYTVVSEEFEPANFHFNKEEICNTVSEKTKEEHLIEIDANDQNSNVSKETNDDQCEENIKKSMLLENITSLNANDQNINDSEETEEYECEKPFEKSSISIEQRENNETEKTSLLSILSNLFPQHSLAVFNFFCQDFGIDIYATPNESSIDLVVNSLINYCSPEEYHLDELKITKVYSVPDDDQQSSVSGCAQSKPAEGTAQFDVDDLQIFFRDTIENIVLNIGDKEQSSKSDKEESNITVPTSPINKEPVQTNYSTPQTVEEPTACTSLFVNNPVPSTSTTISTTALMQSPSAFLHDIIKTYESESTDTDVSEAKRKSNSLNFENALLNNVLPELHPLLDMENRSANRTTKPTVLASRPNTIIKPASFHPKTSTVTSAHSTGGNLSRNFRSIIKPSSFLPRTNRTTPSNQNVLAAGIYTNVNTKAITSSVSSTTANPSRSSSSRNGLNSELITTTINTNLRKNGISKSNPNVVLTKRDTNSPKINANSLKVTGGDSKLHIISNTSTKKTTNPAARTTTIPNPASKTNDTKHVKKTRTTSKIHPGSGTYPVRALTNPILSTSSKSNQIPSTTSKTNIISRTSKSNPIPSYLSNTNIIPRTSSKFNPIPSTSSKSNPVSASRPIPRTSSKSNSIPSTSSKLNRNITEQLTTASTKAAYTGACTNSNSGGSSKGLINAKPIKSCTLANCRTTCQNFVQGLKNENFTHHLPSTSGSTCSFATRKQDINKNTIRVRTDLYDTYFNGPVLQSSDLSIPTLKTKHLKKKEENDDIIFISVDHLPPKTTTVLNPIIINDQNLTNLPTNDTSASEPTSTAAKVPKIEDKPIYTNNDMKPSTSKASETHPYYFKLLEIFPDICPDYLRSLCSKNTENQTVDDLISILLNGDYKRRDRAVSPETHLDFEEQHKILQDLFPDADPTYLQHHCERLIDQPEKFKQFVASLLENKNFPTKVEYLKKMKLSAQEKQYTTEFDVKKFLEVIPNPEEFFNDPKRQVSFENFDDTNYAVTFLKNTFCTTAIKDITSIFKKNDYSILRAALVLEKIQNMKTKRKPYPVTSCKNIPLLQEIAYVKHKKQILNYMKEQELEKKLAREQAKTAGLMKTCQCCYDDEVMPDDTATCEAGTHIFCKECIRKGCEVLIGDGKLDFPCLEMCESYFTVQVLQTVLTPKVFSKMAQRKQMAEVKSAGIEDLEFCPFCDFATIPAPGDKVFRCLNSDCMKESCRLCKEPSHIPLRCDEVEKDKDVKMRTYIEDKMTEALLRKCWKCGMKFIKESGCNKMTCSCGALMCYICNQPVQDYKHFNGQGGDQTHLCPLYSDTHKLHIDAVKRGAESAKKELGVDKENQLKIDPTVDLEQHYRRLAAQNPAIQNIPVMMPQNILPR